MRLHKIYDIKKAQLIESVSVCAPCCCLLGLHCCVPCLPCPSLSYCRPVLVPPWFILFVLLAPAVSSLLYVIYIGYFDTDVVISSPIPLPAFVASLTVLLPPAFSVPLLSLSQSRPAGPVSSLLYLRYVTCTPACDGDCTWAFRQDNVHLEVILRCT